MSRSKLTGGVLLVSGTTIGAGMLALPVITGFAGFFPSLVLLVVYWLYMTYTAFLMLEVNLSMMKEEGAGHHNINLMTMAKRTLGRSGEIVSWVTYLFLLYSLTTAYIAGGGPIVLDFVQGTTGFQMAAWTGSIPLLLIFGFFVYKGTRSVDYVNRILMLGLVVTYGLIVVFLAPNVEPVLLNHMDWNYIWIAVSIVSTSFGFHIIIPSLTIYLNQDVRLLKRVILIGSIIPLIVYIVWEACTLGIVPLNDIKQGYVEGTNGAHLLSMVLGNSAIAMVARVFSFFAIVTSFLGVSLSLTDFLADGFRIKKSRTGRIGLYLMTFLPPLIVTLVDPRAFLSALEYAGAFGVVVLLGLLPALMAWRARYTLHYQSPFTTPGGKFALLLTMGFSLTVICLEIANKAGLIQQP